MHRLLVIATVILMSLNMSVGQAEVVAEVIEYKEGTVTLKGYFANDDNITGKRPGIIVVHEWWGHNEYARKRARMLAELGYAALAVDMYGDNKLAQHPDDAGKFAGEVKKNEGVARKRFEAALAILKQNDVVDTKKIAAIGYCFGGGVVLDMARSGLDLQGVVSFHGSLGTSKPAEAGKVKAKVLVCHGADDNFISAEQISGFNKEMDDAGVDYQFTAYPGAKHSFTNPEADEKAAKYGLPLAYNAAADKQSWSDMQAFFKRIFGE